MTRPEWFHSIKWPTGAEAYCRRQIEGVQLGASMDSETRWIWGVEAMQLWALVGNRSSSAWILAAPIDGTTVEVVVVEGLIEWEEPMGSVSDLAVSLSPATWTWTEKSEYTGLWSENLDSPLRYHICSIPSPFHSILSHLPSIPQQLDGKIWSVRLKKF